jgi:signal transduction histidine kinase
LLIVSRGLEVSSISTIESQTGKNLFDDIAFLTPSSPREPALREESLLLSEQSGSSRHRRLVLIVAAVLTGAFLIILAIGNRKLPYSSAYAPIVDSIMLWNDLVTATLLYSQYQLGRQRSSLALAMGYLFSALLAVPHILAFPGNFSSTGLLGANVDTAFWLYYFSRLGFFIAVIAYSLLKEAQKNSDGAAPTSVALTITSSIVGVAVLVLLATLLAVQPGILPRIMLNSVQATGSLWNRALAPALMLVSVSAMALLWRHRSSVLSMWLLVALWAWLIEILLFSLGRSRYTLFWYGGAFGAIASCLVLLVLVYETTMLYSRAALSAEARSKEGERQRLALQVVTGSVTHELRQPLASIIANSEAARHLLAENSLRLGEARLALGDVASDAHRARDIVNSINVMLKGAASSLSPVSIGKIVSDALKYLRGELRTNNVNVQVELASGLPMVLGDRSQLMQVLVNLITNAIEAMSDRPRLLTVRASLKSPSHVSIAVTDSGAGIDPEKVAHIFDPFFTTKSHGRGLGLPICRRIIEAHGGDISVFRAADRGTVFEILLPTDGAGPSSVVLAAE